MKKYLVEYSSNNSGGNWWLEEKDWKELEKEGWRLFNHGEFVYTENGGNYEFDEEGLPKKKESDKPNFSKQYATYAFKRFDSPEEAMKEFENLTVQDITDEGCNCCGAPHLFSWKDKKGNGDYASGEDCLQYLFSGKKIPSSIRETLEEYAKQL